MGSVITLRKEKGKVEIKEVPQHTLFLQINMGEGTHRPTGEKVQVGIAGSLLIFGVGESRYSVSLGSLTEDVIEFHLKKKGEEGGG